MREFVIAKLRRMAAVPKLVYRKANKIAVHVLGPVVWKPNKHKLKLEKLGTGDGEWIIPVDRLDGSSICYCVGVGDNASLDFSLVEQFHCNVFSFDPTPAAAAYMKQAQYDRSKLRFQPLGVWDEDTSLRLYTPTNNETLLSVFDLKGTGRYFVCKCQKLSTIMRSLGHTHIDLLKLDIEGGWQRVIRNIVEENISVSMVCVEFDSPTSLVKVSRGIRMLRQYGLELVHFEKDNYVFVQRHMLN